MKDINRLTSLIKYDMKPALGVTEPAAIAFAVSKAKSYTKGDIENAEVVLNSGIYKNAFTCGIPNSNEFGNLFAAALGLAAGNSEKGLEVLEDVKDDDNEKAQKLIDENKIKIILGDMTSNIYIKAVVKTNNDTAEVVIKDYHTNIVSIKVNGNTIFSKEDENIKNDHCDDKEDISTKEILDYSLEDLLYYVNNVNIDDISFIMEAHKMNIDLFYLGLDSKRTTIVRNLLRMNDSTVFSKDEISTARLLTAGAIEARVLGLNKPAMSITGSGAHGIICTMPLYAVYKVSTILYQNPISEEKLLRATALSFLITMYIKEHSGRLSAFCGCGIAGGTGAACAIGYLRGADYKEIEHIINNMASGITGMICDGGNQGCVMKAIVALDAGFRAAELSLNNSYIFPIHGINGYSAEDTMKNMGLIASEGMTETEKTIIKIMQNK